MSNTASIQVSHTYKVSKDELWKAITEPDQMRKWFFDNMPDFKLEKGFETHFPVHSEERKFEHQWKVLDFKLQEFYLVSWTYAEYPGEGLVEYRVESHESGSKLTVSFSGLESFPQDIPEFKRESCIGGWEYFLKDRLKAYLS